MKKLMCLTLVTMGLAMGSVPAMASYSQVLTDSWGNRILRVFNDRNYRIDCQARDATGSWVNFYVYAGRYYDIRIGNVPGNYNCNG